MKATGRTNLTYLILVLLLSAYTWRSMPFQVIRSDGFVYFVSWTLYEFFKHPYFYTGFELSAATLGLLLPKIFGMNMMLYWGTAYVVMLITNALFYWLAKTIFKKPLLAFIATIVFSINYFGIWAIYSTHCYCFFLERIIPVLFLLPSAVYLQKYLDRGQRSHLTYSFLLYFLGIGIGHWSVFITGFFLFYPIFWAMFQRKNGHSFIRIAWLGVAFLGITIFFVRIQRIHEYFAFKWPVMEYFLNPQKHLWIEKIVRQFAHWTEYPVILQGGFNASMLSRISDTKVIIATTPYVLASYIVAFFITFKTLPQYRALLLTSVVGVVSIFYMNAFFGPYDVLNQPGTNRYLYYPTMLLSLFWTSTIAAILVKRTVVRSIFVAVLMMGYIFINMTLIQESFIERFASNRSTAAVFAYIQNTWSRLPRGTLIIAPYNEVGVYESAFFTDQLKPHSITVMSEYNNSPRMQTWETVASSSADVLRIDYVKSCDCIQEEWLKRSARL